MVKSKKSAAKVAVVASPSRPSRRAKTAKVDYRKLNDPMAFKSEATNSDEDAEVQNAEDLIDELLDEDQFFVGSQPKRLKVRTLIKREPDKPEVVCDSYGDCMKRICLVCANEIEDLDKSADVFKDATSCGSPLYDVFKAATGVTLRPSFVGGRMCPNCVTMLEGVERSYRQFRREADAFADAFALGQRTLDADLLGLPNTELVRPGVAGFAAASAQGSSRAAAAAVKVISPASDAAFNALSVGFDFNAAVAKSYAACVMPAAEIPEQAVQEDPDSNKENAAAAAAENDDGTITLVFDQDTGTIEHATTSFPTKDDFLSPAELDREAAEARQTVVYITPEEFAQLKVKKVHKKILHLSLEEVSSCCPRLLLGHRIKQQVLLSRAVSTEYQKQVPGAEGGVFTCSDCAASFPYLHMLSNHVHLLHNDDEDEVKQVTSADEEREQDEQEPVSKKSRKIIKAKTGKLERTGETPTLEKPFQCEHCDKCFSEFVTLKEHVEHYHGYSRRCNIEGCDKVLKSIQEFAQHYVRHADPNFEMPTEFEAKKKVTLPCPMCNINILGVWKYVQHSYVHDSEARFACPVCDKRVIKVQNFKDHILRHQLSSDSQSLAPTTALLNLKKAPAKSGSHSTVADAASSQSLTCVDCGRGFANASKLEEHRLCHLPREDWQHTCPECRAPFPSEHRLKLHLANVHSNAGTSACSRCGAGPFANRHLLQVHLNEAHNGEEEGEGEGNVVETVVEMDTQ